MIPLISLHWDALYKLKPSLESRLLMIRSLNVTLSFSVVCVNLTFHPLLSCIKEIQNHAGVDSSWLLGDFIGIKKYPGRLVPLKSKLYVHSFVATVGENSFDFARKRQLLSNLSCYRIVQIVLREKIEQPIAPTSSDTSVHKHVSSSENLLEMMMP